MICIKCKLCPSQWSVPPSSRLTKTPESWGWVTVWGVAPDQVAWWATSTSDPITDNVNIHCWLSSQYNISKQIGWEEFLICFLFVFSWLQKNEGSVVIVCFFISWSWKNGSLRIPDSQKSESIYRKLCSHVLSFQISSGAHPLANQRWLLV